MMTVTAVFSTNSSEMMISLWWMELIKNGVSVCIRAYSECNIKTHREHFVHYLFIFRLCILWASWKLGNNFAFLFGKLRFTFLISICFECSRWFSLNVVVLWNAVSHPALLTQVNISRDVDSTLVYTVHVLILRRRYTLRIFAEHALTQTQQM